MRANITGFKKGDSVEVWFTAGAKKSDVVHLHVRGRQVRRRARDGGRGLQRQHRDLRPRARGPGPEYLSYYTTALADAGISYDVYDVDAREPHRPDPIGVLSHYKAVIWYTGDDLYVREPDAARRHRQLEAHGRRGDRDPRLHQRPWLGRWSPASRRSSGAWLQLLYNPLQGQSPTTPWCKSNQTHGSGQRRRSARPEGQLHHRVQRLHPVLPGCVDQHHRGGGRRRRDAAVQGRRRPVRHDGVHAQRRRLGRQPGHRRDVRDDVEHPAGERVPAVRVRRRAIGFDRPPAYRPAGGHAVRLRGVRRRVLPAAHAHDRPDRRHHGGAEVQDQPTTSSSDYDYVFVEAHTVGQNDWTTLPDKNGHTSDQRRRSRATSTGTPSTRSSTTTRPTRRRPPTAPTPARPACGTPPPATPAASRTGRST